MELTKGITELSIDEQKRIDGGFLCLYILASSAATLVGLYGLAEAGFKTGYSAA